MHERFNERQQGVVAHCLNTYPRGYREYVKVDR